MVRLKEVHALNQTPIAPSPDKLQQAVNSVQLTPEQKLSWQLLKKWRLDKSKDEKLAAFHVLTDEEIRSIVTQAKLDKNALYEILPKKKAIKYAEQIINELGNRSRYSIGKVVSIWYQTDDTKYDRVKLKLANSGEEKWFDTIQELPNKDKMVAVRLNNSWFNEYFYLDN